MRMTLRFGIIVVRSILRRMIFRDWVIERGVERLALVRGRFWIRRVRGGVMRSRGLELGVGSRLGR